MEIVKRTEKAIKEHVISLDVFIIGILR